jgi:hypothetical protein
MLIKQRAVLLVKMTMTEIFLQVEKRKKRNL